jgi:hypothetical protein
MPIPLNQFFFFLPSLLAPRSRHPRVFDCLSNFFLTFNLLLVSYGRLD